MPTRRNLLAVSASIATAGCSGLAGSSTATPEPTETQVFADSGRAKVQTGKHMAFEFETAVEEVWQLRISYDVGVITDGEIGIALLTESEYEDYENGGPVSYVPQLSEFPTSSTRRERSVDPGSYVLVFDNTDRFTEPTNDVTIEYTIRIWKE